MCWDRHCCAALWSATGWQAWLLESPAACLSTSLCPITMTVKVSLPKLSLRAVAFFLLSLYIPRGGFKRQGRPVFVVGPSAPLCQSLQCYWLTFNRGQGEQGQRAWNDTGHRGPQRFPSHSLSRTSTSISRRNPQGLQAPSAREVSSRLWV